MPLFFQRLRLYVHLTRLDRPIGILLLLWPTLWGLWFAADGWPPGWILVVFVVGTVLMRSAGCAINDYADREFDKHVARTRQRPVTSGQIKPVEAAAVAGVLALLALLLIVPLNGLVLKLSVVAAFLAGSYPFTKRFFTIPQAYLGMAFGFGILMAFAAVQNVVPPLAWLLWVANICWSIAYDTAYAMVDRADDLKIGIKTSAITFGRYDVAMVMLCYGLTLSLLALAGCWADRQAFYFFGLAVAGLIAGYHFTLIRHRDPGACFRAFLHNNWFGAAVFVGIALDYGMH